MHITYRVALTAAERDYLEAFTSQGKQRVRALKRAQILLLADGRGMTDQAITEALSVSTSTVYRVKREFVEYGLAAALSEGSRPGQPRKTGASEDALLVSIACSTPPAGRCRWTLSLLAVHNRSFTQQQTPLRQIAPGQPEQRFRQPVTLQKVPELQYRRLIRNRLQIHPRKPAHRLHVIQTVFHPRVTQPVPLLQKVYPQHYRRRYGMPALSGLGILPQYRLQ